MRRRALFGRVGCAAVLLVLGGDRPGRGAPADAGVQASPPKAATASAPGFDVVWSQPTSGARPVRSGGLVVAVAPDNRSVLALAETTGRVVWRSAAPSGVTWSALITRPEPSPRPGGRSPEPLLLATGYDDGGSVLARLGTGGALRWLRRSTPGKALQNTNHIDDFDDVDVAEHGDVLKLFSRARCAAWFLDAQSGERRGLPGRTLFAAGEMIERWPVHGMGGSPHRSCSNTLTLVAALDGVVVVSSFGKRAGLQALAGGDKPRWQLPGSGFRLLHAGQGALVLYWLEQGERAVLARLRARDGQVLWQERLGAGCDGDRVMRWPLLVRRADGEPTAALVQDCERASLYELPSGRRRWTRPTDGALALLTADTAATPGLDAEGQELSLVGGPTDLAVRWFSETGEPAGSATIAAATRAVTPVPGGLVAQGQGLDRITLLRRDGSTAWSGEERFGNSFRVGDRYVVLPSASPTVQVTVDAASGRSWRLPLDSPYVLGRATADPSLWLTTRRSEVVALRLH